MANNRFFVLCAQILVISATLCLAQKSSIDSVQNSIGSFDIHKVQQAVAATQGFGDSAGMSAGPATLSSKINYTVVLIRVVSYLALIIALIFGIAWIVKKMGLASRIKNNGGSMDVLETLPIAQNRSVVLVRLLDKVYLLGQTPGSISILDTLEGEKALELISSTRGVSSIMHFKEVLNNFVGKNKNA